MIKERDYMKEILFYIPAVICTIAVVSLDIVLRECFPLVIFCI